MYTIIVIEMQAPTLGILRYNASSDLKRKNS